MRDFIESILCEDYGRGDLFEEVFEKSNKQAKAYVIAREEGIFSGEKYITRLCEQCGIEILSSKKDKESFEANEKLLQISGIYTQILKIERSLLNLLQHSSGIATLTHLYVKALKDSPTKLLDTRKTRPLLREFEKYSVRNGGASNHRFGLDTLLMLKDTHLRHIHNLESFIRSARERLSFGTNIEIECENLELFERALRAGADILMCDNMPIAQIQKAIAMRNATNPKTLVELSGNITLDNIALYGSLGADAISCGAIIHQARWIDMSMKMH
ncbi:carboxylating nicotinate-nucleotide diphosphorylase [Helicobacter fennelliae]|uniref:carboxylating nicotinate-nucleotide diphosphorylase n=1 Tax=Helicobacter fennelliae TaxID=215 RepID=UPI000E08C4C0|nr:carboxylating nicotinate-nucleotide diphosphorylase [Helicobacter fennelliae]STQ84016.1 nicotinate-nucleotide pyrophosphorylase [Helicobacter fennelliae]